MKRHTKRLLTLTLILSLLLTGCALMQKPFKEVITDWKPDTAYYGADRVFQKVSQPSYVKENVVYQVDNEMELALLAKIEFDAGTTEFFYTDSNFSIGKTYAYLDALMIDAFKFSMGTKTYKQGDKVIKTLDYVKIELYDDHVSDVKSAIDAFITKRVKTTATLKAQIKAVHDGIVVTTHYDTAILNIDLTNITDHTPFEAYGLFYNHTAVCNGYAKAFMGIAQKLNIPVITVSSNTMNHAWNLVYDGSEWLYVDTTFDDPVPDQAGRIFDNYLLLTYKQITTNSSAIKAHVFDKTGDTTLSAQEYSDFATFLFPDTGH